MDEQQLQQQIVQLVQAAMQGDKQATQQIQQIMQAAQQGDQQAAQLAQMIQEVAQQMQQQQVQAAKFGAKLNYIQHLKGVCPEGYEMQLFKQGGQICKKCIQKAKMQNGGDIPDDDPIEAFKKKHQLKARMDKIAQSGKYDKFIPSKPKNVIEGSVRSGKSNFDPNNTTLPSRNADGMQTPNRLQRSGKGSNNILIPKKPIKRDKCGSKVEMDKCGKKMKKKACGGPVKKDQQGGIVWDVKQSGFLPRTSIFRTIQYPKKFEEGVPDTIYRKVVSYGLPFTTDKIQSGKVTHDRTGYFNKMGGGRSKAWTQKVSPSGRAISGQYNQLRDEYNKMK